MKVKEIVDKLNLTVLSGEDFLDKKVAGGYCSDLLSDVMGNAKEDDVWITLQVHKNIMAVAALKDVAAIVLVKGLKPEQEVLDSGTKEGIPVLSTGMSAFEIAGKLYGLLHNYGLLQS